jgi:hypothetical protein
MPTDACACSTASFSNGSWTARSAPWLWMQTVNARLFCDRGAGEEGRRVLQAAADRAGQGPPTIWRFGGRGRRRTTTAISGSLRRRKHGSIATRGFSETEQKVWKQGL